MTTQNWENAYEQAQWQDVVNPSQEVKDKDVANVDFTQTKSAINTHNVVVANVDQLDLSDLTVYWWWKKIPAIDKASIVEGVNKLKEPYNTEVTNLIKAWDIKWLQKYLNENIEDKDGLKADLHGQWISYYNNKIKEDWKFWPQTLTALKYLLKEWGTLPPDPPTIEHKENWDGSWIYHEMSEQMGRLADRDKKKDWSEARNGTWDNFKVDADANTIMINTWEVWGQKNTCEVNWKTWKINIMCWQYSYEAPFALSPLALDSNWFPSETNNKNRETIRAFTAIWNLMNKLKNVAVYQWKWAIEYQVGRNAGNVVWTVIWGSMLSWFSAIPWLYDPAVGTVIAWLWKTWIHLNNWRFWWATDTLLVKDSSWKEVGKLCKVNFLAADMQRKVASLLTAMKLDIWNISRDPDVVDSRRLHPDPLDKKHQELVKQYSKTIN